VPITGLPPELEGKTLVALSDLHFGATLDEAWLMARVKQVMAERPDIVVLLGDVVEGDSKVDEKFASSLRDLSAPLGVWGVLGNHESHGPVEKNVNDLSPSDRNGRRVAELTQTLQGRPSGIATILLSHAPVGAEFAASRGVSLMLCGHTHGGQVWPFSYLVGLRYPLREGLYTVGGMPVIVCRGTGTWATRMRLWLPGSILRITLRRA
jgi:predicted MPP superfamily phosphohydrolase